MNLDVQSPAHGGHRSVDFVASAALGVDFMAGAAGPRTADFVPGAALGSHAQHWVDLGFVAGAAFVNLKLQISCQTNLRAFIHGLSIK